MICEVLRAMPSEAASGLWLIAMTGLALGGLLWLAGARFSRPLVCLACALGGAIVGLRLPAWLGFDVVAWASAAGACLAMGFLGYMLHQLWVGAGLGALAALWACYTLIVAYPGQAFSVPVETGPMGLGAYLMEIGRGISPELHRTLPLAAGTAAAGGVVLAVLLPRTAMYVFYSLLGVTLLSVLGTTAMQLFRPEMLASLPARAVGQSLLILGMVVFGAVVQWRTTPRANAAAGDGSVSGN